MRKVVFLVILIFCASLMVLPARGAPEPDVWQIGVSTQGWRHEFIKNLVDAFEAVDAEMPELQLILVDSEDSVEKQLNDVDNFIARRVDGIIMNGNSYEGSSPAVAAANEAGIPMVQVVSYTENDNYHTFVGTDVKSSGVMAAEVMADLLEGQGRVLMIDGMMGSSGQINRAAGILETLENYPNIELVDRQSGEWDKARSMSLTEDWLSRYPDIDGIIAHNDQMALGAMNALIGQGRTDIEIIGIDGDTEALEAVVDGTMSATILDDVWTEARLAVEAMRDILEGKDVPKQIIVDYIPVLTVEDAQEFLAQRGE